MVQVESGFLSCLREEAVFASITGAEDDLFAHPFGYSHAAL